MTSGRSLWLNETDDWLQLIQESSNQHAEAFPMKSQPRPIPCGRSGCACIRWPDNQSCFGVATRSFASFGSAPKEGGQTFRFERNMQRRRDLL